MYEKETQVLRNKIGSVRVCAFRGAMVAGMDIKTAQEFLEPFFTAIELCISEVDSLEQKSDG